MMSKRKHVMDLNALMKRTNCGSKSQGMKKLTVNIKH